MLVYSKRQGEVGAMPENAYTTTTPASKHFGHLGDIPFNKNEMVIWNLAATTIFLEIWRERNNRIFNESAISSNQTFHVYLSFISFWLNLLSRTCRDIMRHAL